MRLPKAHRRINRRAVNKYRKELYPGIPHNVSKRFTKRLRDSHLRWSALGALPAGTTFTVEQALILYLKVPHEIERS